MIDYHFSAKRVNIPVLYCKDCYFWEKQEDSAQGRCCLSGTYPTGYWFCANGMTELEHESFKERRAGIVKMLELKRESEETT